MWGLGYCPEHVSPTSELHVCLVIPGLHLTRKLRHLQGRHDIEDVPRANASEWNCGLGFGFRVWGLGFIGFRVGKKRAKGIVLEGLCWGIR